MTGWIPKAINGSILGSPQAAGADVESCRTTRGVALLQIWEYYARRYCHKTTTLHLGVMDFT
jgi:hypothetical protein